MIVRVIDFETTGEAPPFEVCEAGFCDVQIMPEPAVSGGPSSWLCGVKEMPATARAIHHIRAADVVRPDLPPFDPATLRLDECVAVAAHNAAFELQFVEPTVPMICTYKAALRVWPDAPGHSNAALAYWLEDSGMVPPLGPECLPVHRAGPDAAMTAHILATLLRAGVKGADMVRWTREPAVLPRCPLGRERGKRWPDVEEGFLRWVTGKPDIDADVRWNAQRELDRRWAA